MHKFALPAVLILVALFAFPISRAQALNQRSWVATAGSGSTCVRTSPCANFVTALAATNPGGEINCVDTGDFGNGDGLFIDRSITIDCESMQGSFGATSFGGGITVGPPATGVVVLRGLDINGNGVAPFGIFFNTGAALHVEKCVVRNFASSGQGWGIVGDPDANTISELFVSDTVLENNGTAASGGGIWIEPTTHSAITRVTLNRVEARNNFFGIKADGTQAATGGVINMTVRDSVSSGNHSNGIVATGTSGGPAIIMMVEHSTSSQNATAGFGVIADGPNTTIVLKGSTVMGNVNGIGTSNGGQLISLNDNTVLLNSTNGTPTSVASSE